MLKYNKVYFLHIPKTGGRFLTKYILRPMDEIFKNNGIELIKMPENVMQHGGWHSTIDDKTYIITVFREPAEFFVSAVCHMMASKNGLIDEENWHIVKDNNKTLHVEKEDVYETLSRWHYINNFQAKNFAMHPIDKSMMHQAIIDSENNVILNKELVYESISRTNLMIRHKDLKNMNYELLVNKIQHDLGIEISLDLSKINKEHFKNHASEFLFNKLTEEDKNNIVKSFDFDKEIYDNDSLFWVPS